MAAVARSLVQMAEVQETELEQSRPMHVIEDFLQTIEIYHLLGNPRLSIRPHFQGLKKGNSDGIQLLHLLQLAVRVQGFASVLRPEFMQSHWHSESEFRELQTELDQFLLQGPDDFCSTREVLHGWLAQGSIDRIHCALVWHYCTIILNRVFLPIRTRRSRPEDGGYSDIMSYPSAPKHFLAERKNVCEAAASTISTICNEVMTLGCFFPVSHGRLSFRSPLTRN